MTKPSDLPEFSSIADAHESVLGASCGYDVGDDDDTLDFSDEPTARMWIEGLSSEISGQSYIAPLADIIRRVASLSGIECPELDDSELPRSTIIVEEGFDDDA